MTVTNVKPEEVDMTMVQANSEAATKTRSDQLHLDDLHVGQRFTSGSHRLDEAQIKAFAIQFDPQPFHTDKQAAEQTFFKGLAASGWHTAAITMRLNVESGPPLAGGFVGAGGELSWPAPTRPGDVLHVESEVVEVTPSRSRPDRGTIVLLSRTINQRGDVVQITKAKLVVPRKVAGRLAKYTFDMGGTGDLLLLSLNVPPWEQLHELSRVELRRTNLVTTNMVAQTGIVSAASSVGN
jgi:acyl dehydratase